MRDATGDSEPLRASRAAVLGLACAVGRCLVVAAGVMSAVRASGVDAQHKVFVCKCVSTPGEARS